MKIDPGLVITSISLLLLTLFLDLVPGAQAGTIRSTYYGGSSAVRYRDMSYYTRRSMTAETWVYREDETRFELVMAGSNHDSFLLGFDQELFFSRGDSPRIRADRGVPEGQWTHVAASYNDDTGQVQFYIDGEPAGLKSLQATRIESNNGIDIAGASQNLIPGFMGYLDEIRLWSGVRTQQEISGNMELEVRNSPDLKGVWAEGGLEETLENVTPSFTTATPPTPEVFGILPRKLVIPKASQAGSMLANGSVDPEVEYAGAEQMVLRYQAGENEVRDAVAYFKRTDQFLFIGVRGARDADPGGQTGGNRFEVYFNSSGVSEFPLSSNQKMGRFDLDGTISTSYHKGAGFVWGAAEPTSTWLFHARQGNTSASENSLPDMEFSINVSELGGWSETDRIGIGHLANGAADAQDRYAPDNATQLTTGTWAEAVYVGTNGVLPKLDLTVQVVAGNTEQTVTLSNSLGVVAEATTDDRGRARFDNVPYDNTRPLTASVVLPEYARTRPASVRGAGLSPSELLPTSATYPPCPGPEHWYLGVCDFKELQFHFLLPPGPVVLNSFTPEATSPAVQLRAGDNPRWTEAGTIELDVQSEHDLLDYYLISPDCPGNPLLNPECMEGVDYFRMDPPDWLHPIGRGLTLPRMDAADYGPYHIAVHDRWERPGVDPDGDSGWTRTATTLEIVEPPYPRIHGFKFHNRAGGGSWEEMTSVYGPNMFADVDGCSVWPHYAMWLPVYRELATRDGSCIGMSVMNRMIAEGTVDLQAWDPDALYGNGHFTNGREWIPGLGSQELAPTPDSWIFDADCQYRTDNLWAAICRTQGMQFSAEMVSSSLPQLSGNTSGPNSTWSWEGDPVEVFNRVQIDPSNFVICMTEDMDSGHCVVPIAVEPGKRINLFFEGDPGELFLEEDPAFHVIKVYDSNVPGEIAYLEIDIMANQYAYPFFEEQYGVQLPSEHPVTYEGQGIAAHPISIWEADHVSMPDPRTPEYLHLIVFGGGADVLHRDKSGNQWGWNEAGDRVDTIPGVKALGSYSGPDGESRNTHAFIPAATELLTSSVHLRGDGDYGMYAAHDGRQLRLSVPGASSGEKDDITILRSGSRGVFQLDGVQYVAGADRTDASISGGLVLSDNESVTFSLDGISFANGNKYIANLRSPLDRDGVAGIQFENGGPATNFDLTVNFADTRSRAFGQVTFTNLSAPSGATVAMTMPHWPAFDRIAFELDRDSDGRPESTTMLTSGTPQIEVEASHNGIAVSYPQEFSGWNLQAASTPAGPWEIAELKDRAVSNGLVTGLYQPENGTGFLRLVLP